MDAQKIAQLETLLGRELAAEEKDRLRRIKDTLHIADNDALWDILTAMEYQRKYYDELPEKISLTAVEIINNLSQAAEKEVALAQSRLAESVVEQAKKLSLKLNVTTLLPWVFAGFSALLLYGSLMLWAGSCIGTKETHPAPLILKMPLGIVLGSLLATGGLYLGIFTAKGFAENGSGWIKSLLVSLGLFLVGGILVIFTIV